MRSSVTQGNKEEEVAGAVVNGSPRSIARIASWKCSMRPMTALSSKRIRRNAFGVGLVACDGADQLVR